MKAIFDAYGVIMLSPSVEERAEALEIIVSAHNDNVWMVGLIQIPDVSVYNWDLRNLPVEGAMGYMMSVQANQYFFAE